MKLRKSTIVTASVALATVVLVFAGLNWLFLPRVGWSFGMLSIVAVSLFAGYATGALVDFIYNDAYDQFRPQHLFAIVAALVLVAMLFTWVGSWKCFHAEEIKNRLDMTEISREELVEMLPEIDEDGAYAWADSATAKKLAARKTGELTDLVSLFTVSSTAHTTVSDGDLVKYIPLEYAGFFKAMKNDTIPGFVNVDPVTQKAEYVEEAVCYSPSAYFSRDLMRHLRNNYPNEYFGRYTYQVSPEGTPTWVMELTRPCGSQLVKEVYAVALVNAVTGECSKYELEDTPDWVSCIHGDTAQEIYNGYGRMINGFWNLSGVGQTTTTDDFGYVAIDGEMYYTFGITSAVTDGGDESNLGLMLFNAHTNKAYYCQVAGAEEYSAMEAAEGVVQNFGYEAAFPSLVNVDGQLTYVMVLKSDDGVVKQYGMVNYENYTIAVTANTLDACRVAYMKAMAETGNSVNEALRYQTIIVDSVEYIVQGGETTVYVRDIYGDIYKAAFEEGFLFLETGDSIEVAILDDTSDIAVVALSKLVSIESMDSKLVSIESVDKSDDE